MHFEVGANSGYTSAKTLPFTLFITIGSCSIGNFGQYPLKTYEAKTKYFCALIFNIEKTVLEYKVLTFYKLGQAVSDTRLEIFQLLTPSLASMKIASLLKA